MVISSPFSGKKTLHWLQGCHIYTTHSSVLLGSPDDERVSGPDEMQLLTNSIIADRSQIVLGSGLSIVLTKLVVSHMTASPA